MKNNSNIEVTSEQLLNELTEIKDRVGALENVAGIANRDILVKYFKEVLNSPKRCQVMAACKEPKKKKDLVVQCGFQSVQALDHHLAPLREGLIHETHIEGSAYYEWSLLFKRLPKAKKEELLEETDKKPRKKA